MNKLQAFSPKQMKVLTWWCPNSPYCHYDAIICDGAVRSGKTVCMSLSFVFWASIYFNQQNFALCGKTLTSLKRNVVTPLVQLANSLGFQCSLVLSRNYLEIQYGDRSNRFYLFGGKDESSAALIQGVTLAGILFDEVALMPRSFVEQALARCSVEGSKFWFNCNPEHPFHWFYLEWIQKAEEKHALYLHFQMEDNPSLSPQMLKRYQSLYSGAFYDRFVLGKWTSQSGIVYPMFQYEIHVGLQERSFSSYYISCDYGITNPTSMGLWGCCEYAYRIKEYYYDSCKEQFHRTDEEHYQQLEKLAEGYSIQAVVVDPSASSFIECIRRHGKFQVIPAINQVNTGISLVSDCLLKRQLLFSPQCKDTIQEFSIYCWEENSKQDRVKKENDHAMDDIRYFISTIWNRQQDSFFVYSAARN